MIRRLLAKLRHAVLGHDYVYGPSGNRRACCVCGRREIATNLSRFQTGSRIQTIWTQHTYPLDADPLKDPTPIWIDGEETTLGAEAFLDSIMVDALMVLAKARAKAKADRKRWESESFI